MKANLPVLLAVGPGMIDTVMIVIAVVFPVLHWIYKLAKGGNETKGSQPRRGPGGGPQQLAQRRQEELRRRSRTQFNQAPSQSDNSGPKREKTARELARELYQQRAEALRAQLASTPTVGLPEALRAERGNLMFLPGVVRPAAAPARRPAPPRQAVAARPLAPTVAAPTNTNMLAVVQDASDVPSAPARASLFGGMGGAETTVATIRGSGGRPALVLMRNSLREAIILREVLDRPLAMRDPVMPI